MSVLKFGGYCRGYGAVFANICAVDFEVHGIPPSLKTYGAESRSE
jgi:hypothetical protein